MYEVDSRLYIAYFICGFSGSKLPFNIKRYVHRTHIFFKVQSFGYYFAKYTHSKPCMDEEHNISTLL